MTQITVVGNIGGEVELHFTPSGAAVCNFSVADQQRRKNAQTGEWEDGETTWYRVNVWRQQAENVAESLSKGDRVIVLGRVQLREYTASDGSKGRTLEITADAIGPDTKFATTTVNRVARQAAPDGYGNQGGQQQGGQYSGQQRGGQQGQQGFMDAPPF
jgi:single-strand DNA-binding protein